MDINAPGHGNAAELAELTGAAAGPRGRRGNQTLTLLTVAVGVMMVALDGTIVAVANPAIQASLHANLADLQWITNAYLLGIAVTLITIGKIGDRFGHKKVFMTGVVGFATTSAVIGLSGAIWKDISLIIVFRAVQGVFAAMLQPTALALLREAYPAEKLNRAIGYWAAVLGASTAAGPIVGGLLVQHINWESCFYVNVPVGVAAFILSAVALRETPVSPAASSFDFPGIAALTAGLFLLVWALIKAPAYGWGSAATLACFAAAVILLALFAVRQSRAKQPLLPLQLFRSVPLSAGIVLVLLLMFGMFAVLFLMTLYLENVHGLGPVATGVRLLPMTVMMAVGPPLSGRLITRLGPCIPMVAGMLLAAVALFGLSRLGPDSGSSATFAWFVLLGLGLSPVIVGATDVIVGTVPHELNGVASGLQATAFQVGGTIGTAVLGAVVSGRISGLLPANWHAAGLPALSPPELAAAKTAVSVGLAPATSDAAPQTASVIVHVSQATFVSAMDTAFLVSALAALIGAVFALATRGSKPAADEATVRSHLP
jgi:EmrB/QacA subfamily drug resistance transporter